jgi:hypothetical protein
LLFEPLDYPIGVMDVKMANDETNSDGEFKTFSETKGFFSNFFRSGGVFVTFSAAGKSKKLK